MRGVPYPPNSIITIDGLDYLVSKDGKLRLRSDTFNPDPPLSTSNEKLLYIYVITKAASLQPSKIGSTNDPMNRLTRLQTGHDEKLVIYRDPIQHWQARLIEREIKATLKNFALSGGEDWYDILAPEMYRLLQLVSKEFENTLIALTESRPSTRSQKSD